MTNDYELMTLDGPPADLAPAPTGPQALDLEKLLEADPRLQSEHTRRGYLADLRAVEAWRAGRPITRLLAEQYAAELQAAGLAPRTINRRLSALRWQARRLADLANDTATLNPDDRAAAQELGRVAERIASVANVRGSRKPRGRHLTAGELGALLATCADDPSPAGARDAALIALAWATGARRDELAGLTLADLTPTGADAADLLIRGKGNKERTAYLYNGAYAALGDWLTVRGNEPGPIFCAIGKGGRITPAHALSGEALRLILAGRIEAAHVKPLTWHDFRRTFAGGLLDAGIDLATVQRLMGHSDPGTTSNYDRRPDETRRQAVRALHVPYSGRLLRRA